MINILIFGLPRTATTALQVELSLRLRLHSFKEPFCGDAIVEDLYSWVNDQSNSVMKLLTTNICQAGTEKINILKLIDSGITHLVITQRKNLVDCCISLYYAERIAKQYHYISADQIKHDEFEVDEDFLTNWLAEVDMYYSVIDQLFEHQVKYDLFDYDAYVERRPQNIFGHTIGTDQQQHYVHSDLNYSKLCLNYQEVKAKIEDYVKRIQY